MMEAGMGPLHGVRVLEMAAIGPVPFCAMMLADAGAEVLRLTRPGQKTSGGDVTARSRPSLELDLKAPGAVKRVHALARQADVLLEGGRPGVMERLGLGPDALLAGNPRLVYGRMTGWGQDGPLAHTAGHDINYIALSGALHAIGRAGERPVPPLNLVGDYGGGAMFLAFGVLAALLGARRTGHGQVVDAAMTDGSAALMALFAGWSSGGRWSAERGTNLLDGGAPWYDTYETADGRHVAVGALEEPFWRALLQGLGLDASALPPRADRDGWPRIRAALEAVFRTRTRDHWAGLFASTDACVTPVLDLCEAAEHPHNRARGTFVTAGGIVQPSPSPRFSDTPSRTPRPAGEPYTSSPTAWDE